MLQMQCNAARFSPDGKVADATNKNRRWDQRCILMTPDAYLEDNEIVRR